MAEIPVVDSTPPSVAALIERAFQACQTILDDRPETGTNGNSETCILVQRALTNLEDAAGTWIEEQAERAAEHDD